MARTGSPKGSNGSNGSSPKSDANPRVLSNTKRSRRKLLLSGFAVLVLAACAIGWFWALPAMGARAQARLRDKQALALLRRSDEEGAENAWLTAIAAWPQDVEAYSHLGDFYAAHGEPEVAGQAYLQILRYNPHFPHVYCRMAIAARDDGSDVDAYKDAQKEVALDPRCPRALSLLAMLDRHRGDTRKARDEAERAYQASPNDERIVSLYAEMFSNSDPEKSIAILQKAREKMPHSWKIVYDLGWCYARVSTEPDAPQKALKALREAEALSPGLGATHLELCRLLVQTGDIKAALPEGEMAVRGNPSDPQAFFYDSQALQRSGQVDKARKIRDRFEALQKALNDRTTLTRRYSLKPGDPEIAIQLADDMITLGDMHEAVVVLEEAISLHPRDDMLQHRMTELVKQGVTP